MKTRSWLVIAGLIVAVVALFALVAPATFAQGPAGGYGPGYNRGTAGPGAGWLDQAGQYLGFGRGAGMMGQRGQNFGPGAGMMGQRGQNFGPGAGMMGQRGQNFGPGAGMMGQRGQNFGRGAGMMQQNNGYGLRLGGPENSLVASAAAQLDLTQAEVMAELQGGQTLAEVITSHNGDPAQVVDTFVAGRSEQLAELVANGQLSQEQADTWLATIKENATARLSQAWSPRGNGQGFVDEDGDGVCDNCGLGRGNGAGFVDEDGDGVCDNCGAGPRGGRMGQRWQ